MITKKHLFSRFQTNRVGFIAILTSFLLLMTYCWPGVGGDKQKTVLHCGYLVDVQKGQTLQEMSITLEDDLIESVTRGYSHPADAKVINLTDKTCLPGFIDLHVHFEQDFPHMMAFHHPDEARSIIDSLNFPKKTLFAGFTTVRDLGSVRNVTAHLKYAIENGKIIGPRILNAGVPISAPGGHGDFLSKLNNTNKIGIRDIYKKYYEYQFITKKDDVRKWFQHRFVTRPNWYKEFKSVSTKEDLYPDAIKMMATGGVVSDNPDSHKAQLSQEIVEEIVAQTKIQSQRLGKTITVTAHAHGLDGIADAVLGGVDTLEHGTELFEDIDTISDPNEIKERQELRKKILNTMADRQTYLIPTLMAGDRVVELAKKGELPEHIAKKALVVGAKMFNNFNLATSSQVPIALGSDTGISAHGDNWKEFVLMVKHGKMSPCDLYKQGLLTPPKPFI